ncbi:MAG: hypothetical protein AAF490_03940 [Chloroflexota bacterium]
MRRLPRWADLANRLTIVGGIGLLRTALPEGCKIGLKHALTKTAVYPHKS